MEEGVTKWRFGVNNEELKSASGFSIRTTLSTLTNIIENNEDERESIPLGHGDPSAFPSFRTTPIAEDAVVDALKSAKYNTYCPSEGLLPTRRAVAEYLSRDLPYKLSPEDVYITVGCIQAIDTILTVLARPNANILIPRPAYPHYEARSAVNRLQVRHFDLLPEKGWEVDLEVVEALVDENTVAMVIINPGNPCGNVYTHHHLKKVAETARKLGIMVIADEVYAHLCFGSNPFIPMGVFSSIVPVITLGSISKRWVVPGWRLGWLVVNDTNNILRKMGVIDCLKSCSEMSPEPPTFIQGAVPDIIEKTKEEFFSKIVQLLRDTAVICYDRIKDIPCFICPFKPEGSMFIMVKLNLALLKGIHDDIDFCLKLAKEESVVVLPGIVVGLKNWLRITFAIEPSALEDGFARIKAFCQRHANKQQLVEINNSSTGTRTNKGVVVKMASDQQHFVGSHGISLFVLSCATWPLNSLNFIGDRGCWSLPKFGEWEVNNPASADKFTVIFCKVRDEKKTSTTARNMVTPQKYESKRGTTKARKMDFQ